jgi:hypothetical protein
MSLKYVFNPFTGNFDAVPVTTSSAQTIPIVIAQDTTFEAPTDQVTFFPHVMKVNGVLRVQGLLKVGG